MVGKIGLYKGAKGRGKTLSLVKDLYQYFLDGYRVLTNFHTNFSEFITNDQVLRLNKDSDLFNCVLGLDEIQLIFDSRNFRDGNNISFSYFIMQVRKRDIIILGTAQYADSIEKRFRQNLDFVASPYFYEDSQLCIVNYYDITILEDLDFNPNSFKPACVVFEAEDIFSLYDTYEMIV